MEWVENRLGVSARDEVVETSSGFPSTKRGRDDDEREVGGGDYD